MDVIEEKRRGDLVGQTMLEACVDQRGIGFQAELAEQCHEQQRLVFAIAPASFERFPRLVRLVGVASHLDAEVADVVLHEADGGGDLRVARGIGCAESIGERFHFGGGARVEPEHRLRPRRHFGPRRERRHLHRLPGLEPCRHGVFDIERGDVRHFPRVRIAAHHRLRAAPLQRTSGGPEEAVPHPAAMGRRS